ncbi:MAG: PTS sugar transporter subunit IIA [Chlamydiota bacterium]|nr:PTS sugar transporter subunit IIA [Chlamydiota bacterium]
MSKISKYLDKNMVVFLDVNTRDEAVSTLVNLAHEGGKIHDEAEFYNAIIDRERIVSTGIGMAVAIPHAKLAAYDDFFIVIGILSHGVDWNTIDGSAVRIIFMIGGPDDKQTEYLQILSGITSAVKKDDRRKQVINASSQEEVIELLKGF